MNEQPTVICDHRAAECHCALTPGHEGPHECGREGCGGIWAGEYETDTFEVVRYPGGGIGALLDPLGSLSLAMARMMPLPPLGASIRLPKITTGEPS